MGEKLSRFVEKHGSGRIRRRHSTAPTRDQVRKQTLRNIIEGEFAGRGIDEYTVLARDRSDYFKGGLQGDPLLVEIHNISAEVAKSRIDSVNSGSKGPQ